MPNNLCYNFCHGNNPTNLHKSNHFKELKNNNETLILCLGSGNLKPSFSLPQSTPTFHVIFITILFVIIFPASLTTALPTRLARSYTGRDNLAAGLILKQYSTPMTVKVAFLHPKTHNLSTDTSDASEYVTSPTITPPKHPHNATAASPQVVAAEASHIDPNNNDNNDKELFSAPTVPIFVLTNNSEATVPPSAPRNKHVNLAVIPVLGIFFLMILVCFKGCSWFREHLKEHDTEDDGKDYVILSPPEDGYREVEFRSDTSSMYYDTVSSYRSILRQKGEFGSYSNYDTVTSIRSYLQRADVRDAAVQVRLHGQRPDRWKSVSGILNNGGGSNSDLLRVPKKSHRQVSFQTSQNETYDPPSPRMCDVNIQVGNSTMDRLKPQDKKFQNGIVHRQLSPNYGSRSYLASANPNRHSSSSLRSMDKPDHQALKRTDSTGGGGGGASTINNSAATSVGLGVEVKPKNRRVHHFQVLRVNSIDRLSAREMERIDTSPLRQAMMTSHYMEQNRSSSGLAMNKTGLPIEHQDQLARGELYGAPMTTMCHPHYLCDQFVQTDSDSANDAMSPVTAAAHTSISPPILTEVKLEHLQSDDEDSDALDKKKKFGIGGLDLYIGESSDTTTGEESMVTSGRNSASWSEQMDEEDQLQKLLQAHASSIARAPIASPISMGSTSSSSSSTDDVAQRVELDRTNQNAVEAADATTVSDESGDGRSGVEMRLGVQSHSQVTDSELRDEETPLIERSEISCSPYSQSPDIGALSNSRPHRVSSGYDTQGPESSSVFKGLAEGAGGDSSCDITPLTSSSNSLQECGRESGRGILHPQLPLQLLIFQHAQQEERAEVHRAPDFENRQQGPSHAMDAGKDDTLKAQNTNQPLSYIPQLHSHDTNNNNSNSITAFNPNNDNTFPRHSLGSTDSSSYSNQSSNVSMENVQFISAGLTPPTPTDRLSVNPITTASSSKATATENDNTQPAASIDIPPLAGSDNLKTSTSTLKDSFSVVSDLQEHEESPQPRLRTKTDTLPPVVIPLNTLPPPPPSAKGMSSYQARKRANTSDSNIKR